jgi:hypothetical protein
VAEVAGSPIALLAYLRSCNRLRIVCRSKQCLTCLTCLRELRQCRTSASSVLLALPVSNLRLTASSVLSQICLHNAPRVCWLSLTCVITARQQAGDNKEYPDPASEQVLHVRS